MTRFQVLAAAGLALLQSLTIAAPSPCFDGLCITTRADLNIQKVTRELGSQLSSGATIFGPSDPRYEHATARYQNYNRPNIQLVVVPAQEKDIPKIVKYANANSIKFWVKNRGHALVMTNGNFTGIQIDMSGLRTVTISPDKKTAVLGGGSYGQQTIDALWAQGFVTTTGSCACVGLMGPGLGGGYGRYQGLYGLVSDNVVTYNVVLADGTAVTTADKNHPDLLWAMRGAGHNFGIVTSFKIKIYPKQLDTWYYKNYLWTQDKLEKVFTEINKLNNNGKQPAKLALQAGTYAIFPAFSTTEPVLLWSFAYIGAQKDAAKLLKPFDAIESVLIQEGNVPYPEIPHAGGSGLDDQLCAEGFVHMGAHANLQSWNVTTQRQIYDLFRSKIQEHPEEAATSVVAMEGYSQQGVKAVAESTSSFPWRNAYNVMGFVSINYLPNPALDAWADDWRKQTRDLWLKGAPGKPRYSYVNYAFGDEPVETVYGPALNKLSKLKGKYDPFNRFGNYVPIAPRR